MTLTPVDRAQAKKHGLSKPSEHLAGTSVFKQITGGDVIQGEYKFKV